MVTPLVTRAQADIEASGLDYVDKEASRFAKFVEERWGGFPPGVDRRDACQETHARLAAELGPDYGMKIGLALAHPDFATSPECTIVRRCKWAAAGVLRKRKNHAEAVGDPAGDFVDPTSLAPIEEADRKADLEMALERLDDREKRIWPLLYDGKTCREIEAATGVPFQRVGEIRWRIIQKLAEHLRE